ncbi:MAG: ferritin family protein [Candidatus Methanoperedens sp.]|nr:ferritin family protein [Candidatus Methanoperedens sp.]
MQTVEIMEKTFQAESGDIALYLAMSKKAADEGDNDTARYFYNVAMDEARHAAEFATLLGKVKDTRSNLAMMLEGEINSEKEKAQAKDVALAEGHHEASQLFEKTMHDERRHTAEIKSVLSKLQEKD